MPRGRSVNPGGLRVLPKPPAPIAIPPPVNPTVKWQVTEFLRKDDVEGAVQCIRDSMGATKHEKTGRYTYTEVPDNSTRLSAAKIVLEYVFGKPDVRADITVSDGNGSAREMLSPLELAKKIKASGLDLDDIIEASAVAAKQAEQVQPPELEQAHAEGDPDERAT